MNFWPLVVLATAIQATAPFHWEFDLRQCTRYFSVRSYDCYGPSNGNLIYLAKDNYKRFDYQMHPHIFAINAQSSDRWLVAMQSRSRKQKVDLDFGMILHRLPDNQNEEKLLECRVANGKIEVKSSADIETELVDSYFDEHHLYCDFIVKSKKGSGKAITDIVSEKDKFALSVSMDGKSKKYIDGYNRGGGIDFHLKYQYISTTIHGFVKHECDLSQAKYDPSKAPKDGKIRLWEVFGNELRCPDNRYFLHVSDGQGRSMKNIEIHCKDGKYQISDPRIIGKLPGWTVQSNETFNAYCHVEDRFLCPISIPCDKEDCPYVEFNTHHNDPEFTIKCNEIFPLLVVGDREYVYDWLMNEITCKNYNLVIEKNTFYDRMTVSRHHQKSPPNTFTEAYCASEKTFYHPDCARRNPLCNGKSCSIVKAKSHYKYNVTCTNPNHVFQEFSSKSKQWSNHGTTLHCNANGEWYQMDENYARCKDPKDTDPPAEFIADQEREKSVKPAANQEKRAEAVANAQSAAVFSIALTFVLSILTVL